MLKSAVLMFCFWKHSLPAFWVRIFVFGDGIRSTAFFWIVFWHWVGKFRGRPGASRNSVKMKGRKESLWDKFEWLYFSLKGIVVLRWRRWYWRQNSCTALRDTCAGKFKRSTDAPEGARRTTFRTVDIVLVMSPSCGGSRRNLVDVKKWKSSAGRNVLLSGDVVMFRFCWEIEVPGACRFYMLKTTNQFSYGWKRKILVSTEHLFIYVGRCLSQIIGNSRITPSLFSTLE